MSMGNPNATGQVQQVDPNQQGGFSQFMSSRPAGNMMQAMGAALLSSPMERPFQNLPQTLQTVTQQQAYRDEAAERQRKLQQEEQSLNATTQWLQEKHPDLVPLVSAGNMELAINEAFRREQESRKGSQPQYFSVGDSIVSVTGDQANPIYSAPPQPVAMDPFTLSAGETRFGPNGEVIASGGNEPRYTQIPQQQVEAFGLDPTKAWQIAPDGRIQEIGASGVTVNNNMGNQLSPGWEAIDKSFAPTYLSWVGGGSADTQAQLDNLDNAIGLMESGQANTGNALSALPREIQAFVNSDGLIARENVEETVQRSLRETLGAQFTEREGERLIQRAFNPLLPTEENTRRVRLLIGKLQQMARAKDQMAQYFRQNGTLMGYEGETPSMQGLRDVEAAFGPDPDQDGGGQSSAPTSGGGVVDYQDYFN